MARKANIGEHYNIAVKGRNVLVTDAMKNYAVEKVSKIERFTDRIIDVTVTMDIQKLEHRVDIVIKAGHIKIKGHASSEDMYISIDKAVSKIQAQLYRYKTKIQDHQAKHLSAVDMKVNVLRAPDAVAEINDDIEEENQRTIRDRFDHHQIVATETKALRHLTQDEAIMKMDLSGDAFLVFRGQEDKKLKVIYRRKDQNYGVIEVEA